MRTLLVTCLALAIFLAGCQECHKELSAEWRDDGTIYDLIRAIPDASNEVYGNNIAIERQDPELGRLTLDQGIWVPETGEGLRLLYMHGNELRSAYDGPKTDSMDRKAVDAVMTAFTPFTTDSSKLRKVLEQAVERGIEYPECNHGQSLPNCDRMTEWHTNAGHWNAEAMGLNLHPVSEVPFTNTTRLQASQDAWTFTFMAGYWKHTADHSTISVDVNGMVRFEGLNDAANNTEEAYESRVRSWLRNQEIPEPESMYIEHRWRGSCLGANV